LSGDLPPGAKLPSERELTERYGTTNKTVREALAVLRAEGRIESQRGVGVFVRHRPPIRRLAHDRFLRSHREAGKAAYTAELEAEKRTPKVEVLSVEPEPAPAPIANLLQIAEGEKVLARRRRYFADGEPMETAVSYVPLDIARGTEIEKENTGPGGIYARLEELGHRLHHFTEEIQARMPRPDEARLLSLGPGIPVFHLIRTAYDETGRPVEVCDTIMAADRYTLTYELPAN
ncbi:MAG: UTRA domain-containing protein, partial [Nitriliruptorales bacterium]|nr:UTRA domain-containing protein [Nitriliruptorales bacterium]